MRPLVEIILNRLNEVIEKSVSGFQNAGFINCRNVTDPYTWRDDMHPADDGFKALAAKFEARMTAWSRSKRRGRPRQARSGSRRRASRIDTSRSHRGR